MTTEDLKNRLTEISPEVKNSAKVFLNSKTIQKLSRASRVIKLQRKAKIEPVTAVVLDLANQMYLL
jgi:hypothetical protein